MDGHVDGDLLVPPDDQEVHVEEPPADVIGLDLTGHGQVAVLADVEIDQDVGPGLRVQDVIEVAVVNGHLHRLHPVAVEDRGDLPLRTDLSGRSLAASVAEACVQLLLGHVVSIVVSGGSPIVATETAGRSGATGWRAWLGTSSWRRPSGPCPSPWWPRRGPVARCAWRRPWSCRPPSAPSPSPAGRGPSPASSGSWSLGRSPLWPSRQPSSQFPLPASPSTLLSIEGAREVPTQLRLVLAVEDLGDGSVLEHGADRARDARRDRQDPELPDPLLLGDRDGVRDHDLLDGGLLDLLHGLAR